MPSTIINERYELLQTLGAGGMAVVHKAMDLQMDRIVAVKILREHLEGGDNIRKRFFNEAKLLANLSHSNIVFIYDFGIDKEQPFIVMEYLHGTDLHEMIQKKYPLSLEQKLKIAIQIARALKYAHSSGIVHRDIKPSNVRILKDGVAKLVDFGIATMNQQSAVSNQGPDMVLGSLRYMSPEQLEGKAVHPTSDIFSFGSLLYELLAYKPAFGGDSVGAVMAGISFDDPPPLDPGCPERLKKLVAHCLKKTSQERLQSADRLIQELRKVEEELWGQAISKDQTKVGRALLSDTGEEGDPTLLANAPEVDEETYLMEPEEAEPEPERSATGESTMILERRAKARSQKTPSSPLFSSEPVASKTIPWAIAGVLLLLGIVLLIIFLARARS